MDQQWNINVETFCINNYIGYISHPHYFLVVGIFIDSKILRTIA